MSVQGEEEAPAAYCPEGERLIGDESQDKPKNCLDKEIFPDFSWRVLLLDLGVSLPVIIALLCLQLGIQWGTKAEDVADEDIIQCKNKWGASLGGGSVGLGLFVACGAVFTFNDQMAQIIVKQTFKGVDPFMLSMSFINILWIATVELIKDVNLFVCTSYLTMTESVLLMIPIWELCLPPILQFLVHCWCLLYARGVDEKERRKCLWLWCLDILVFVLTTAVFMIPMKLPHTRKGFGLGFSILACISSTPVWLPQIWLVWKMKGHGSLSLVFLALQAPGNFIQALSLMLDAQSVLVVLPCIFIGAQQAFCFVLAVYFAVKNWKAKKAKPPT